MLQYTAPTILTTMKATAAIMGSKFNPSTDGVHTSAGAYESDE